ncbi:MAG: TonB family protein [Saprospiraceae bacterium]
MKQLIILSFICIFSNSLIAQEEQIFTVVEEMPILLGCENDSISTKQCTERQLLKYIYKNIQYPQIAKENRVEGLVVFSFVVNTEGKIENPKVLKDIGAGCGEEAIRVIETMNEGEAKWMSGKQKGQKVKVKYNIPVRFKLQKEPKKQILRTDKTIYVKKEAVDKMPVFKGCENSKNETTRKSCTETNLLKYVYKEIDYKQLKKDKDKKTGVVVISFVIDKEGKVKDIKVLKSAGKIYDEEAIRTIKTMNEEPYKWIAGEQKGKKVKVSYTIPILLTKH